MRSSREARDHARDRREVTRADRREVTRADRAGAVLVDEAEERPHNPQKNAARNFRSGKTSSMHGVRDHSRG
jgi:hypothetical protein